ncbi:uncharacterized protein [Panulirus ornatus]|uniref:uncharacterized protein isoform X2 n=1 Tax=Panulirus ornatus TaxID=150431 RepID=UPI003A8784A5
MKTSRVLVVAMVSLIWHVSGGVAEDPEVSRVMVLQESLVPNTRSFARWEGTVSQPLASLTLCYRLKIYHYRPEVTLFSYINNKSEKIRTDHNRRGMQVLVASQGQRLNTDIVTPLMTWAAFCIALSTGTQPEVFFNGEKWQNGESHRDEDEDDVRPEEAIFDSVASSTSTVLMEPGGTIVLGQDQDAPADAYDATQSFSGAVTDVNVWSRQLSDQEMMNITSCRTRGHGDVLDWNTAVFEIGDDSSQREEPVNETCDIFPQPYFMFQDKLQFSSAARLCKAFGGELATPMDAAEQEVVYSLAQRSSHVCTQGGGALMWLGITDEDTEGSWRYFNNQEPVQYLNWAQGQPNGQRIENCAVIKGETFQGRWVDQSCRKSFKVCTLCRVPMPVFLRFRGICDSTLYDDRFVLEGTKNQKPYFRGYYRSHIYYTDDNRWRLQNIMVNDTYAQMEDDGSLDFPVGRHLWKFSHGFCGEKKRVPQSLTLTQCAKNEEFTCDDGTCIHINQVCDRRVQCPDMSDELDCSTVVRPKGYQPTLPPPSIVNTALPVYLNLTLSSFASIDAINNRFTVELLVRMIWKDQRLQFKHLRSDRQLNIILPTEAENIWVPIVDFLNAENNQHTVVDADCKITIKRLGEPLGDNIENSKEARIYQGLENYIRISRKYTIVFQCSFDFFYYPFNTDYCSMIFRINKNTHNYVTLERYGGGIRYEARDNLAEYAIGGIRMSRLVTEEPYSGLETLIQMKHLYTTQMVTIFIPTTLINIISFTTFLFKWFDFQNRIMVSLTALLVLSTLFSQISDTLPKTSYFKLIDVWFFISIVFAFLTIITHTIVEFNHHYGSSTDLSFSKSSSPSSFPMKVLPASDASGSRGPPIKPKHPHARPMFINKVAYIMIMTTYVLFFCVFWGVAFTKVVEENGKKFDIQDSEVTGYPE